MRTHLSGIVLRLIAGFWLIAGFFFLFAAIQLDGAGFLVRPMITEENGTGSGTAEATTAEAKPEQAEPNRNWNAEARSIFYSVCAACHGQSGRGDGVAAAALTPKPRDMTDAKWQESIDDPHFKKLILKGGLAVGKSPIMPPYGHILEEEELLEALVRHVRSLRRPDH